jgi:hypothetical protein
MNHVFCSSCGNKIQYNLAKPNFCTKCGSALSALVVASKTQSSRKPIDDDYEDLDEDETGVDSIPDISKLAFEVESDSGNRSFTFGSLFGDNTKQAYSGRRKRSVDDFIDEKKR